MKNPIAFHVPPWLKFRRWLLRTTFRPVFRILCHIEITGLENIPREGAYIIAYNHVSFFEPPFILAFWPSAPEALSGADVFFRPGQSFIVRAYGAIPVKRDQYDRKVIEKMLALLQAGNPLVISPEGGRSHKPGLRQALPGVAYLMDLAKAPVLPVGIVGGTDDMLFKALRGEKPHLELHIGPSFMLPPIEGKGDTRRQARQHNADTVMLHIAALLPKEYHGVYSNLVEKSSK